MRGVNRVESEKPYISFHGILGLWVGDSIAATRRNDWQRRKGLTFRVLKWQWPFCPHLKRKMTLLPSVTWRWYTSSIKKCNIVIQKMYTACNYKVWQVHCSILYSMERCAKHDISWRVKCNKPLIYLLSILWEDNSSVTWPMWHKSWCYLKLWMTFKKI